MTDTKKKRGRPKKTPITFNFNEPLNKSEVQALPVLSGNQVVLPADVVQRIQHQEQVMKQRLEILSKSVKPIAQNVGMQGKYTQNKIIFSSKENRLSMNNVEQKPHWRVQDPELKALSISDPYISAIISTRCNEGAVVSRPSNSKFDKGTRVLELKPLKFEEFNSKEEFTRAQKERQFQMEAILSWFQNCGTSNSDVLDEAYRGNPDPTFKRCSLADYMTSQIRNLLTFGRMARHNIRDMETGTIIFFRPVPVETIRRVYYQQDVSISSGDDTIKDSIRDAAEYNSLPDLERPQAWEQVWNGQQINFFTDYDLEMKYFQKQALFDLGGYPLSPIELAIQMIWVHQQTLEYLRNMFIKGFGSKGVLVIQSNDPMSQLSPEDLEDLRSQFHNYISRNDNSSSTPVISGPVTVDYKALNPTPKDMEFLQLEEHIIRALCSAFQVSPEEMGYGHLSMNQGGLTTSNKQDQIIHGQERGLRSLLDIVYDDLNEILYEHFPAAKDVFRISYTGVGEDTRDAVVQRSTAELQTTATMASLYADSEKLTPIAIGGDVPLSPAFHAGVAKYLKYGDFMEMFFGMEGASKNPDFDFIIDPSLNTAYMQAKQMSMMAQNPQMAAQMQGQDPNAPQEGEEEQPPEEDSHEGHSHDDEESDTGDDSDSEDSDEDDVEQSLADALDEATGEEEIKSIKDALKEHKKLAKSMDYFFKSWISLH